MLLGLSLAVCLQAPPKPPVDQISAFKAAYESRKSNEVEATPDPGVSKALDILIQALREGKNLEAFEKAIAKSDDATYETDLGSISGSIERKGKLAFVMARMGFVSRTVAFEGSRKLGLPKVYSWNRGFTARPFFMKSNLVLLKEISVQDASVRIGLKISWLKRQGDAYRLIKQVSSPANLDQELVTLNGDRATIRTIDPFKTLFTSYAEGRPERITTWDCASGTPKIVKVELKDKDIRLVDATIDQAWNTKKPTAREKLIRKLLPKDELLDSWEVKKLGKARTAVDVGDIVFILKRVGTGYVIESVKAKK